MSRKRTDDEFRSHFTEYNGQIYRSQTEAKWAAVFEGIGIRFKYEPVSFRTPFGLYVPDFQTPEAWIEVKGLEGPESEEAAGKIRTLAGAQKKPVIVFCGKPDFKMFSDGMDMCNCGFYLASATDWRRPIRGRRLEVLQVIGRLPALTGFERAALIAKLRREVKSLEGATSLRATVEQVAQAALGWARLERNDAPTMEDRGERVEADA